MKFFTIKHTKNGFYLKNLQNRKSREIFTFLLIADNQLFNRYPSRASAFVFKKKRKTSPLKQNIFSKSFAK